MRAQQGLTLLEAMVVIMIMMSTMVFGMSFTQQWYADRQLDAQVRDVKGLMQQAQLASMDHGRPWTLCGSRDGQRCDGQWQHLLVMDAERHVRYHLESHEAITLRWKGLSKALVFQPRLSGSMLNGTFYLCHTRETRKLIVNRLGRTRVETVETKGEC
ncbi:type IV fimbrial biogenesis protein FimT [Kushneria avicenniae]|uniref:Type II secretion system protein H n=1 Tax=Kushneria avicenniae TaxID=402385 RepID=A0A1I1LUV0_9GAMM|nr:GspH/FimT family pseudopilin [Kushneria avicenniae]SFC76861.1 type IV fimbrial biogenesis protein FimT [Kushneria avicenniae]